MQIPALLYLGLSVLNRLKTVISANGLEGLCVAGAPVLIFDGMLFV